MYSMAATVQHIIRQRSGWMVPKLLTVWNKSEEVKKIQFYYP